MSKLAARIKMCREGLGLSVRELAESLDASHSTVWRWEKGKSYPHTQEMRRLAQALSVSVAWLMGIDAVTGSDNAPRWTREFRLERDEDVSGVSGEGTVAIGVQLPTGRCVVEWLPGRVDVRSIVIYRDIAEVQTVHGHDGKTRVTWADQSPVRLVEGE